MLEMTIAGLRGNIETKLNAIRMSNPLYFHQLRQKYNRLLKDHKARGYGRDSLELARMELEELLESIDDTLRGDV